MSLWEKFASSPWSAICLYCGGGAEASSSNMRRGYVLRHMACDQWAPALQERSIWQRGMTTKWGKLGLGSLFSFLNTLTARPSSQQYTPQKINKYNLKKSLDTTSWRRVRTVNMIETILSVLFKVSVCMHVQNVRIIWKCIRFMTILDQILVFILIAFKGW